MEVGFGDRVGLIEIDDGLARQRVVHRCRGSCGASRRARRARTAWFWRRFGLCLAAARRTCRFLDDDALVGDLTAHSLGRLADLVVIDLGLERFPATRDVLGLLPATAHVQKGGKQHGGHADTDQQHRALQPTENLRNERRTCGRADRCRDGRRLWRGLFGSGGGRRSLGRRSLVSEQRLLDIDARSGRRLRARRRRGRRLVGRLPLQIGKLLVAQVDQAPAFFDVRVARDGTRCGRGRSCRRGSSGCGCDGRGSARRRLRRGRRLGRRQETQRSLLLRAIQPLIAVALHFRIGDRGAEILEVRGFG